VAKLLIDAYPAGASKATKDGYLPLHCILCNDDPDVPLVTRLIELYPQGVQQVAVDLVPVDDDADATTWTGDLKEKRWTPLSKAIEKGLRSIITLLQAALPKSVEDSVAVALSHQDQTARGKTPLSSLRSVRPLPSGFLPPSLRQAAFHARSISTSMARRAGNNEGEKDSVDTSGPGAGSESGMIMVDLESNTPRSSTAQGRQREKHTIETEPQNGRPNTSEEVIGFNRSRSDDPGDGDGKIEIVIEGDGGFAPEDTRRQHRVGVNRWVE
jgi:hypothetical protein